MTIMISLDSSRLRMLKLDLIEFGHFIKSYYSSWGKDDEVT